MAIQTIVKKPIGPVDIKMDTAGAGTTSNFTRVTDSGGTEVVQTFSADDIPVIDAPVVTGASQPFALITPSTDRDVEACLARTRIESRSFKNFEHYGGIAGAGISVANAQLNTEVFEKIMRDIVTDSRAVGIYFPGTQYEFHEKASLGGRYTSAILPIETAAGTRPGAITLAGMPDSATASANGTRLLAHASADATFPFLSFEDQSNILMADMAVYHVSGSTTDNPIDIRAIASSIQNIVLNNLLVREGLTTIHLQGDSTRPISNVWIQQSDLASNNSVVINARAIGTFYVQDNVTAGTGGGIAVSGDTGENCQRIFIRRNQLQGTAGSVSVSATGTYSSILHRNVFIENNFIDPSAQQSCIVSGIDKPRIRGNQLNNGQIQVLAGPASLVENIDITGNLVVSDGTGNFSGIEVSVSDNNTVTGLEIASNQVIGVAAQGILVSGPTVGGKINRPRVHHNEVIDPGRNSGVTRAGIHFRNLVTEGDVNHNYVVGTEAVDANKFDTGLLEDGTTPADNKWLFNAVKGYDSGGSASTLVSTDAETTGTGGGQNTTRDLGSAP